MTDKHYLDTVREKVDKTHPNLGNLTAMSMLTIKARKLLLVVSPAGCGKSVVSSFVGQSYPEHIIEDRLTIAGLVRVADEMTGFKGVVVVDDLAKTQTPYTRINTITTLAEIVYSHYVRSHVARGHYEISDFQGSGIVNVQPVLLRQLVKSDEWEASIQDKTFRYYHLFRPQNPNDEPLKLELKWGVELDEVEPVSLVSRRGDELLQGTGTQWGLGRQKLHMKDLLRATAALDNRSKVKAVDFRVLGEILKPLEIEKIIMDKSDLEARRFLHNNRLAILVEFATYGEFTLETLARDYKVSQSQAYRILDAYHADWVQVAKSPATFAPSEAFRERLKEVRLV